MPRRKPNEPHWTNYKRLSRTIKRRDKANDWLSANERGLNEQLRWNHYMKALNHPPMPYLEAQYDRLVRELEKELARVEG
jgi:hypothetical protein